MYGYVARQPIFKKNMRIYGYELLFREGMANFAPQIDEDTATSELLSNTYLTSDLSKFTGGERAFINFTRNLLINQIPLLFPRATTVVEILENVRAEEKVVSACREIAEKGYMIALDDFVYTSDLEPLISLAKIIKIDFRQGPIEIVEENVRALQKHNKKLLAEKIESYEEFQTAIDLGFHYFQGYFFAKPQIIKRKRLATSKLNLLRIMGEINRLELDFDHLEKYVSLDITISYKLLNYINSAYYRRVVEISSIRQAIVLLGEIEIRRFLSLMAMSKLADNKPDELIKLSAFRAKFCELLGINYKLSYAPEELFTLGLFSIIDAIMDDSMENIMEKLPLSQNIKDALVSGKADIVNCLKLAKSYEKGQWDNVAVFLEKLNIKDDKLPAIYIQALEVAEVLTRL